MFERREGPRPDLVIFGSGANEHYDTPDEVAIFEGAIRWIQRHYPETEFLFSMWGDSTSSPSDMQALALRYQIPFLDFGEAYDETRRWCNPLETVGHPEAWVHDLWFKTISQAFQCWDPIQPGQAQLQLPERVHPNTYGWEGDIATFSMPNPQWKGNVVTFSNSNPRLHDGTQMIIEDTAFNQWAWSTNFTPIATRVDGVHVIGRGTGFSERAIRNSTLAWGRLPLGDRHIVEVVKSPGMSIIAVDCKVCPNRRWIGVESPLWRQNSPPLKSVPFESLWGAPYGSNQVVVSPGTAVEIDGMATDVSVAFVDTRKGGSIRVFVDGVERFKEAANRPFVDAQAQEHYIENRKGIRGLPYGLHTVRVEAVERPVPLLGLFLYDARSNRAHERRLTGLAAPGETLVFSAPFQARPRVFCTAPLAVNNTSEIRADRVTFAGTGPGAYEIVGE